MPQKTHLEASLVWWRALGAVDRGLAGTGQFLLPKGASLQQCPHHTHEIMGRGHQGNLLALWIAALGTLEVDSLWPAVPFLPKQTVTLLPSTEISQNLSDEPSTNSKRRVDADLVLKFGSPWIDCWAMSLRMRTNEGKRGTPLSVSSWRR
jgi:hypothetical protein